jgi:hypothetical protein
MANLMLAEWNRVPEATLTGGSWTGLGNVKDARYANTAVSAGVGLAQTVITAAWAGGAELWVVALAGFVGSVNVKLRWTARRNGGVVWRKDWYDAYPDVPFGVLEFGAPNWWTRKPTARDIARLPACFIQVMPKVLLVDDLTVEIDDRTHPTGSVEIGHLFAGPALRVQTNYDMGSRLSWVSRAQVEAADAGSKYGDLRAPLRRWSCALSHLNEGEALAGLFDMMGRVDLVSPFLMVPDADDAEHIHRTAFMATFESLPDLERAYARHRKAPLQFIEWR